MKKLMRRRSRHAPLTISELYRALLNEPDTQQHCRGSQDVIPRGSVSLLYQAVLEDDGTLARALTGDRSFLGRVARSLLRGLKHPVHGPIVRKTMTDRLRG
jgi:hypothetical protein